MELSLHRRNYMMGFQANHGTVWSPVDHLNGDLRQLHLYFSMSQWPLNHIRGRCLAEKAANKKLVAWGIWCPPKSGNFNSENLGKWGFLDVQWCTPSCFQTSKTYIYSSCLRSIWHLCLCSFVGHDANHIQNHGRNGCLAVCCPSQPRPR